MEWIALACAAGIVVTALALRLGQGHRRASAGMLSRAWLAAHKESDGQVS